MKKVVIGLLLVAGLAAAKDRSNEVKTNPHMSWWTKLALNTQSPRIHTAKIKNDQVVRQGDRVVSDKTTINAFIPYGK